MHSFAFERSSSSLPPAESRKDCLEMRDGCFRLPQGYHLVSPLTQSCTPWQRSGYVRNSTAILSPQPSLGDSSTHSAQTSVQGVSSMEASFTGGTSNAGNVSRAVRSSSKNGLAATQTVLIPISPVSSKPSAVEDSAGLTTRRLAVIQNGKLLLTPHTVQMRKVRI
ncbi:unnamed protein product [Schistocephalus solidus]|uniref:Uncharacterized protein n=1 Tax=Schistocephalus solidus TaxID=70667 RepID=A0A183T7F6_SCHSO|nr:unnamed protein product [Schistocephalus solidus]